MNGKKIHIGLFYSDKMLVTIGDYANVAKLAYGAIPVYEAFVPLTLLVVGGVLVLAYADIEFLADSK